MNKLTAIAAAYADAKSEVKPLLTDMLCAMKHRGNGVKISCTDDQSGVGFTPSNTPGGFFESDSCALAIDGTFFTKTRHEPAQLVRHASNFKSVMDSPGAYAIVSSKRKALSAVRDPIGLRPLYYSTRKGVTVVASERKALWRIGHINTERILPGYVYTAKTRTLSKRRLFKFHQPSTRSMTMNYAAARLKQLLQRSIHQITGDVDRVAVAFSGGLDSAITALFAKQANLEVELFSTGLKGSVELQTVEKYAKALELPIRIETYDPDSLEPFIKRIIWLIEEHDLMKVSIAIPLHWAAKLAARRGHTVMLCGQGSDELYGGYYKYARILDGGGKRALASSLYRGVIEAAQVNYERDEQATCACGVELRTPFATIPVIDFSLRIPLDFKVRPGNDVVRKWVLRAVALNAGLPGEMVWRRKKAIQHGTGVENAIRKIARSQQMTTDAYLAKVSMAISKQEEMP